MKSVVILSVLLAGSAVIAKTSKADPLLFVASLSGAAEAPPNMSPGTGFAMVT